MGYEESWGKASKHGEKKMQKKMGESILDMFVE